MMRIGVDIDGVLNYHHRMIVECGTKYCTETGKGRLQDLGTSHLREMFGWDKETRDDFWKRYGAVQLCVWPAQTYAAEVIRKLRAEGNEIWIITGRSNQDMLVDNMLAPTWEETTKLWLAQNDIEYDTINFGHQDVEPDDKGTFCAENNIAVMIEDDPGYLRMLKGKTYPIVFDAPYNREADLLELTRAYSWYDVYNKIQEVKK